MRINMIKELET